MTARPAGVAVALALLAMGMARPAAAADFEPRSGRTYVVRDLGGNVMERLQPAADAYIRLGITGRRLGRAVPEQGGTLKFYNASGTLVATAGRGGKPPMSMRLRSLAVVRGVDGESLGIVAAR